jgi:hypothetical protein
MSQAKCPPNDYKAMGKVSVDPAFFLLIGLTLANPLFVLQYADPVGVLGLNFANMV